MRIFVQGIYASGKTFCAKELAAEHILPYINFDINWDYDDKNCSAQVPKFLNKLPQHYVCDAIPYDDNTAGINEFLKWEFDKDDVQIRVVFCSDRIEWFRRLREVKNKTMPDQFYVNSFYFVLWHRILSLKNRRNVEYYDTFNQEMVPYAEFIKRLEWVLEGWSNEPVYLIGSNKPVYARDTLTVDSLHEILQQQEYDWDHQDVEVLGFESGFQTSKTWRDIRDLVQWDRKRVVDIGTNHAYIAIKADECGAKVIGLDKHNGRLEMAKKIVFVSKSSVQCSLWQSGEPVPECDIVLCLNVLHHIHNKVEFFKTLKCSNIIFELKLSDVPIVQENFDVVNQVSSHRG